MTRDRCTADYMLGSGRREHDHASRPVQCPCHSILIATTSGQAETHIDDTRAFGDEGHDADANSLGIGVARASLVVRAWDRALTQPMAASAVCAIHRASATPLVLPWLRPATPKPPWLLPVTPL